MRDWETHCMEKSWVSVNCDHAPAQQPLKTSSAILRHCCCCCCLLWRRCFQQRMTRWNSCVDAAHRWNSVESRRTHGTPASTPVSSSCIEPLPCHCFVARVMCHVATVEWRSQQLWTPQRTWCHLSHSTWSLTTFGGEGSSSLRVSTGLLIYVHYRRFLLICQPGRDGRLSWPRRYETLACVVQ